MLRVFMHPAINEELTVCGVFFGTCRRDGVRLLWSATKSPRICLPNDPEDPGLLISAEDAGGAFLFHLERIPSTSCLAILADRPPRSRAKRSANRSSSLSGMPIPFSSARR